MCMLVCTSYGIDLHNNNVQLLYVIMIDNVEHMFCNLIISQRDKARHSNYTYRALFHKENGAASGETH